MSTQEEFRLDPLGRAILAELMRDASQTLQQIAARVGRSPSPVWKRIQEMKAAGVIRGHTVVVDPARVGLGLRVIVACNLAQHSEDTVRRFEAAVAASPAIVECRSTTGESDYLMTVLVPDIRAYERFLHDTLFRLPGITHVRSSIVLKEVKAEVRLPLGDAAAAPRPRASARGRQAASA
jgi:Lrp/AsnC family leucine-responsive transcriptional regulator